MSVIMFGAEDLGRVLACSMAAVTAEGHLKPAEQTRLGLSIAQSLAEVSKLNRKTYATRYGEIPPASVKASDITKAAAQIDPFEEPDLCSTPGTHFKSSMATNLAYNTDLRAHPKVAAQLQGLHEAMSDFARKQHVKVEQAKGAAARGLEIARVDAGRYPWLESYVGHDGKPYLKDKPGREFTKELASALKEATGKTWSVSRSRGTASSWVRADAPPARRTCEWDGVTPAPKGQGYSCMADRETLGKVLRVSSGVAHPQGESIQPGPGCREHVYDVVKGRPDPAVCRGNDWD